MPLDESKCEYQTMSLFSEPAKIHAQPIQTKTTGKVAVYFDGGCLGNPGKKYGSFQVKLDGREIGNGKPGALTARVLEAFRRRVLVEGTRI